MHKSEKDKETAAKACCINLFLTCDKVKQRKNIDNDRVTDAHCKKTPNDMTPTVYIESYFHSFIPPLEGIFQKSI